MFPSGGRDKHTPHQVWPDRTRLSLEGLAPIAREMQVKQGLRPAVFPSKLSASLIVPVLTSCASGPHAPLNCEAMIMLLGRPSNNDPVPGISNRLNLTSDPQCTSPS